MKDEIILCNRNNNNNNRKKLKEIKIKQLKIWSFESYGKDKGFLTQKDNQGNGFKLKPMFL